MIKPLAAATVAIVVFTCIGTQWWVTAIAAGCAAVWVLGEGAWD